MVLRFYADRERALVNVLVLLVLFPGGAWFFLIRNPAMRSHGLVSVHQCGWILAASSVLLLPYVILNPYLRSGPHLIIDREGIDDRAGGLGRIPWEEIVSISVRPGMGGKGRADFLCLELRDPETYLRRLPVRQRILSLLQAGFGYAPTVINFSAFTPGLPERIGEIRALLAERAGRGLAVPRVLA